MFLVKNKYSNILLLEILLLRCIMCSLYICIHLENIIQNRIWNALEVSDDVTKHWTCTDKGFQLYLINLPIDTASLYSVECKSIRRIEKTVVVLHN